MTSQAVEHIRNVQTAYNRALEAELTALRTIQFPLAARRKSPLSDDNFLVRFLPKYYLEDFHTTTLAYLLTYSPVGDEKSKPFLRLFLELLVRLKPELAGLEECSMEFGVEQEARSDGWIDILLINRASGTAIIVENKIHANDQDRQIPRYYDEVTKRPFGTSGHYRMEATVYLTLTGRSPSYIGWTKKDMAEIEPICIAYAGSAGPSLKSSVLDIASAIPGCEPVKSIVNWYGQIVEDLSGRSANMELVQDFARNVIDDTKAMGTIADVINGRSDIEAALCQELGDRVFAELQKMSDWSVSRSKHPEGQEISIDCGNKRWHYAVWAEGNCLSHGFVGKGKPFSDQEKVSLSKKLPGDLQVYNDTYYRESLSVDLANRNLADRFTESGIRQFIDEVKAIIG